VRDDIIFDIETATIIAEDLEEADVDVNLVQSRTSMFHCYGMPDSGLNVLFLGNFLFVHQPFQFLL
jgi:hypothetical protein